MEYTLPHPYLGKEFIGYVLNTPFSAENQQKISELQEKIREQFSDAIFVPPPETLHITLMDWLAPLVDYDGDKDELFKEIYGQYDNALEDSIKDIGPIEVNFNKIGVSREAIFIMGEDNGQYQEIRNRFLGKVKLLPNTKRPPQIIHSTIARYLKPIDLQTVQDFTANQSLNLQHVTEFFRLFRTIDTTMDTKKLIKKYDLITPGQTEG